MMKEALCFSSKAVARSLLPKLVPAAGAAASTVAGRRSLARRSRNARRYIAVVTSPPARFPSASDPGPRILRRKLSRVLFQGRPQSASRCTEILLSAPDNNVAQSVSRNASSFGEARQWRCPCFARPARFQKAWSALRFILRWVWLLFGNELPP